jgi:two-component system cell cycle response regulator CtrA
MDLAKRLEVVEAENAILRERIANLEAVLTGEFRAPIEWRLTGQETRVFSVLVGRAVATKGAIMAALYSDRADEDADVEPKIVDVFICKIRKKLKPFGITIQTVWGQGYSLETATRASLSAPSQARAA